MTKNLCLPTKGKRENSMEKSANRKLSGSSILFCCGSRKEKEKNIIKKRMSVSVYIATVGSGKLFLCLLLKLDRFFYKMFYSFCNKLQTETSTCENNYSKKNNNQLALVTAPSLFHLTLRNLSVLLFQAIEFSRKLIESASRVSSHLSSRAI